MLVLARQINKRILIPAINTAIEVVAIRSGSVRLGIEAPEDVTILREELWPGETPVSAGAAVQPSRAERALRNSLHDLLLGLEALRRRAGEGVRADLTSSLEQMKKQADAAVTALDQLLRPTPNPQEQDSAACTPPAEEAIGSSA
jgi:carbon storage regulator CsrA